MTSKVQICNMALSRLGASIITSLTDGTTNAKLCNTLFDDLSDRVLTQGSWAIAINRVQLAVTTTAPSFGYTYEYQLPTSPKCLKVLNVDDITASTDYRIEGDKLLTDISPVSIRYIGRPSTTEEYSPLLVECIEVLLASYLAYPITGDKQVAQSLKEEYVGLISNNLAIDGQQGSKDQIAISDLVSIRLTGGYDDSWYYSS